MLKEKEMSVKTVSVGAFGHISMYGPPYCMAPDEYLDAVARRGSASVCMYHQQR